MTNSEFLTKGGCIIKVDYKKLTWTKQTSEGKSKLHFGSLKSLTSTVEKLKKDIKYRISD